MTEPQFQFIKSCGDCPLANQEGSFCQHPDAPAEFMPGAFRLAGTYVVPAADGKFGHLAWHPAPPECPLRKQPITLSLEPAP